MIQTDEQIQSALNIIEERITHLVTISKNFLLTRETMDFMQQLIVMKLIMNWILRGDPEFDNAIQDLANRNQNSRQGNPQANGEFNNVSIPGTPTVTTNTIPGNEGSV